MKRAMARQAEAEPERRAKVIAAEGKLQAAGRLSQAAGVIFREWDALALRTLQPLAEVASEHSPTLVFPIAIKIFDSLPENGRNGQAIMHRSGGDPAQSGRARPGSATRAS
jgi:hypothetical protein